MPHLIIGAVMSTSVNLLVLLFSFKCINCCRFLNGISRHQPDFKSVADGGYCSHSVKISSQPISRTAPIQDGPSFPTAGLFFSENVLLGCGYEKKAFLAQAAHIAFALYKYGRPIRNYSYLYFQSIQPESVSFLAQIRVADHK